MREDEDSQEALVSALNSLLGGRMLMVLIWLHWASVLVFEYSNSESVMCGAVLCSKEDLGQAAAWMSGSARTYAKLPPSCPLIRARYRVQEQGKRGRGGAAG